LRVGERHGRPKSVGRVVQFCGEADSPTDEREVLIKAGEAPAGVLLVEKVPLGVRP